LVERRFGRIPQALVRFLDQEGHLFFTEILDRLSGAATARPGTVLKMPALADSTATDVAGLKADFNTLLARLRAAGAMEE
jgi:hypothetical protein